MEVVEEEEGEREAGLHMGYCVMLQDKTSSLLLDVRRCLEDLVRTNEEQEVNRMLIAEIKLLGKQDVDWRGLQDWEAEMLQKIVGDIGCRSWPATGTRYWRRRTQQIIFKLNIVKCWPDLSET